MSSLEGFSASGFQGLSQNFEGVVKQIDRGLALVKHTARTVQKVVDVCLAASLPDTIAKLLEGERDKDKDRLSDGMAGHLALVANLPGLLKAAPLAQEKFCSRLLEEVVTPLNQLYNDHRATAKAIITAEKKLTTELAALDAQIKRDREPCIQAINLAKSAKEMADADPAKHSKRYEAAKAKAVEACTALEKLVERANGQQKIYYHAEMPRMLYEMQEIEARRLQALKGAMAAVALAHGQFMRDMQEHGRALDEALPTANADADMRKYLEQQLAKHGRPVDIHGYSTCLPVTSEQLRGDNFTPASAASVSEEDALLTRPWANECTYCHVSFTLFNRRHHCRACRNLLCGDCCPKIVVKQGELPVRCCTPCRPAGWAPSRPPDQERAAMTPVEGKHRTVRAMYDFPGENTGDLPFHAGEIITVAAAHLASGDDWVRGTSLLTEKEGHFPRAYVEEVDDQLCVALFAHTSEDAEYVNFKPGDQIQVLQHTDETWWFGRLVAEPTKKGYLPAAYVQYVAALGSKVWSGGSTSS